MEAKEANPAEKDPAVLVNSAKNVWNMGICFA